MSENFNITRFIDTIDGRDLKRRDSEYRAKFWSVEGANLAEWYIRQAHRDRKNKELLFDVMHEVDVVKDIAKVVNTGQESEYGFPLSFVTVLTDLVEHQTRKLERDDILDTYEKCIAKILKPVAKEFRKEANISKELAFELLSVLPTPSIINKYNSLVYTYRINRKLYAYNVNVGEDESFMKLKQVRKIFRFLFGEDFEESKIAIGILLEHRSDDYPRLDVYSLLTVYALDTLESLPKSELRDAIKEYGERRSKDRDMDRRIRLGAVNDTDYPRILKAIKKVTKQNENLKNKFD